MTVNRVVGDMGSNSEITLNNAMSDRTLQKDQSAIKKNANTSDMNVVQTPSSGCDTSAIGSGGGDEKNHILSKKTPTGANTTFVSGKNAKHESQYIKDSIRGEILGEKYNPAQQRGKTGSGTGPELDASVTTIETLERRPNHYTRSKRSLRKRVEQYSRLPKNKSVSNLFA